MIQTARVASDDSPPRNGSSRIFYALAGSLLLGLACVVAVAPWAFSNSALSNAITDQIRRLTGLTTQSGGHAVFVVLPEPHVSLTDVVLDDPSGALRLKAGALKAYVRLWPLLTGRIEIASVTLDRPDMAIDLDRHPVIGGSVIGEAAEALPASPAAAVADETRLGAVTLIDGRAQVHGSSSPADVTIEAIDATLDWRKPGAAAILTGQARVSGETASVALWIADPAELLRGGASLLSLKIDSASLNLSVDGSIGDLPNWQFKGSLHAATPSLRALLERVGSTLVLPGPFRDFEASSVAAISPEKVVLSSLHLTFDGNELEGALALQAKEKSALLSGTLATNRLSLRPFLSGLPPAIDRDGQWNRDPFDPRALGSADLDLRLSAAHLVFSHFEMEDAAFSILRNNGRLELALAGAKAYQGEVKGRVIFEKGAGGVGIKAEGAIAGADFAALSFGAFGWPEFNGALTGKAHLESSGVSRSELMRGLEGQAQIEVGQGQLGGIDIESALHRIDKSPLTLLADIHRGRTAFDHAGFRLLFTKGQASIVDGRLENPHFKLDFGGSIDFGERALDLHAIARPEAPASPSGKEEGGDFHFDIGGGWDNPVFSPDVRGLIRRSDAAAPLFSQHEAEKPVLTPTDNP
ncbi:MAG TPA: AsmA family protein [Methylocella sp.]|nr:AsmA family protein [Methylocella sp.]